MKTGFHSGTGSKLISGNKDWLVLDCARLWGVSFLGLVCLSLVLVSLGQDVVLLGSWACIKLNKVELYRFGVEVFISGRIISSLSLGSQHFQKLFF